ncbi:PepSY domain-containing protein [soil metagenome]
MNKQQILPLTVLTIVALGGATFGLSKLSLFAVHAQSQSSQVSQITEKPEAGIEVADDNKQEPSFTSSIRTQTEAIGQEVDDATEAKQLETLAKISSDQAKTAAEAQTGGKATNVKLEEENGNVVYAITVGTKEVKVDAGNGKVLHTETAEAGDSGEIGGSESN